MKPLRGKIVSNKMDKTVVVEVKRQTIHPLYKKLMRISKRYKAHVEDVKGYTLGDMVVIVPSRPFSKSTHYKVVEKVRTTS